METRNNNYDAVIIGFGKGGKTLAAAMGKAGKRTVLIEQSSGMYGGTCINVGCIPTKYLVHKAQEAKMSAGSFEERAAMYEKAVEGKSDLTGKLREKNYQKVVQAPNVTVITGRAKLLSPHTVEVTTEQGREELEGAQIFLNTGSVAFVPPIEGLKGNPYAVTSEGLLELKKLPEKLVIIGGGYIGVEFASIYADFGSSVTILQNEERFLPREDEEIAGAVRENLESRGAAVITGAAIQSVLEDGGRAAVTVKVGDTVTKLSADVVLVATGRRPNTAELGLDAAGVELNARGGVAVNEHMQTSAPHIYAMGDVAGGLQFTYISLDDFRIVKSAVLGDGSYTLNERGAVPYSVFLNPPFSRVGISEQEAVEKGYQVKVARLMAGAIPKAQVLDQPSGLLKAVIDGKTGLILGAHLFCEESHEMVNLVKLAMDAQIPYTKLRDMIYTHPTMSEAFNDLFNID